MERKEGKGDLLHRRNELLDKIADLREQEGRGGRFPTRSINTEFKELKFHLGKILERMADSEAQENPRRKFLPALMATTNLALQSEDIRKTFGSF